MIRLLRKAITVVLVKMLTAPSSWDPDRIDIMP
jgi:hypothetical protein